MPFDFLRWLFSVATVLKDTHSWIMAANANLIANTMVPYLNFFKSDFAAQQLGAVVGLVQLVMIPVTIIVGLVMMALPSHRVGIRIGQIFSNIWILSLFIIAFYPLVDLVLLLTGILKDFVLFIAGVEPSELVKTLQGFGSIPGIDPVIQGLQLGVMILLGGVLWLEVVIMATMLFFAIILFPLMLVLRVLGGFWDRLFHGLFTSLIILPLAPAIMSFCLLLPLMAKKVLPLGDHPLVQLLLIIGSYGLAIAVPSILWGYTYAGSTKVFGRVESSVAGVVDVNNTVRVSIDDVDRHTKDAEDSPAKAFVTNLAAGAATAAAGSGGEGAAFMGSLKHVAVDAAAIALTVGGHPIAAGALQAVDSMSKNKEQKARQANPGPPAYVPPTPQPPPPPKPNPVPKF